MKVVLLFHYRCSQLIEVSLLKNKIYWSVAIGATSVFLSDLAFLALTPAILGDIGFTRSDVSVMMTVHLGCDLAGRISYSVLNIFHKTRNRYVYWIGACTTFMFRICEYLRLTLFKYILKTGYTSTV